MGEKGEGEGEGRERREREKGEGEKDHGKRHNKVVRVLTGASCWAHVHSTLRNNMTVSALHRDL